MVTAPTPTDQRAALLYAVAEGVATITLNRPTAMNAFMGTMREALLGYLQQAAADPAVGCLVLTGTGKAFCAGGDIAGMAALQARDDVSVLADRMTLVGEIVTYMRCLEKPVVAAINGVAAGGGMNLALACDIRYAAESASFSESFIKIGLVPDWGGHARLTQLVGTARALELMLTGARISAEEAARLGIVNQVFSDTEFGACVTARARLLAAAPREAVAAIKHGVYLGAQAPLAATLAFEREAQIRLFLSAEAREGMAAFLEKRAPKFGAQPPEQSS